MKRVGSGEEATRFWRTVLMSVFALYCAGFAYDLATHGRGAAGDLGFICVTTSEPFRCAVRVQPDSAAYAAGMRDGDIIDYRDLSFAARAAVKLDSPAGFDLRITVHRGSTRTTIAFVISPRPWGWSWQGILGDAEWLVTLLCAGIVAWWGSTTVAGRLLAALLLQWSYPFSNSDFASLNPAVNTIVQLVSLLNEPAVFLLLFLQCFGKRTSLRTILLVLNYAVIVIMTVVFELRYLGVVTLAFDAGVWWIEQNATIGALVIAVSLLPLAYGAATLAVVSPAERSRVAWVYAAAAILGITSSIQIVMFYTGGGESATRAAVTNLGGIAATLLIVYAVLNRRVLDAGFALNRAAVFTAVSVVVVGLFVLLEWAATEWLGSASRTTNVVFSAALALALGLSSRFIHARAERVMDELFFRKRHEDEAALYAFARQALYISRIDTLLERTRETLRTHADATSVTFWLDDGSQFAADEDDPALVALRAGERYVLLRGDSALPGTIAYPLPARGKVIGALVLADESAAHSFAPDEMAAVEAIAQHVGIALDSLRQKRSDDELQPLVEVLRDVLARLSQAAPPTIT